MIEVLRPSQQNMLDPWTLKGFTTLANGDCAAECHFFTSHKPQYRSHSSNACSC